MSIFSALFGEDAQTIKNLKRVNREIAKERDEALDKIEDGYDRLRRDHKVQVRDLEQRHEDAVAGLESKNKETVRELNTKVDDMARTVKQVEADYEFDEEKAAEEKELAVSKAVAQADEKNTKTIDSLKDEVREAKIEAARANSTSEERVGTIKALNEQLKNYQDFTKFVLGKLPEVDLSEFNINVDMPATEVVVTNQGGKKGK